MKYCDARFSTDIISKLNPFGEIAVDTNHDERMTMLLMCHVVREFFDRAVPQELRDETNNDGVKLLLGLSNTLGYRLDKAADEDGPSAFTFMVGELTLMLMMMEQEECINEAIHAMFGAAIPNHLTAPLHEKIFTILKRSIDGSYDVYVPETPEESLFAKTTLHMVPAQGGVC